jgi:hypothetical protein
MAHAPPRARSQAQPGVPRPATNRAASGCMIITISPQPRAPCSTTGPCATAAGSQTSKRVPWPGALFTSIAPPYSRPSAARSRVRGRCPPAGW